MLIGSMVHDKIKNDMNISLSGLAGQVVEVRQRSVHGIDIFIVGNVIAEVDLGRRKARRYPDCVYAQVFQIIEL